MNHSKFLSAVILLVLTQFAWGIGNPEFATTSPYYDISTQKPKILKENTSRTGQISDFNEVDFFAVVNPTPESKVPFPIADVELQFSCPQADTSEFSHGWYVGLWKHNPASQDVQLKGYDVSSAQCTTKNFSITIDQNEDVNDVIASYYISVQSGCAGFPDLSRYGSDIIGYWNCDRSDYKLKIGLIPKEILADTNTLTANELKNSIPLGAIKTGQIKSNIDKNVYSVETYSTTDTAGTNEVPLLFSCTAAAARQTNDWKLTVYDDKNTVAAGYPRFINGSDCGSTLVDDKGGFKFTLPKDSPRYFVSVQSSCDSQSKKKCNIETSQYSIARDVTRIYTGNLSTTKSIKESEASFKLTRCGLNSSSTIAVKVENADLREMFKGTKLADKKPIKLQIGTMACQILTPQSFAPAELMLGSITGNAEIIDASLKAKDSMTVTLGECISSNKLDTPSKITLTGTKLDLENLNPTTTTVAATTDTVKPSDNSVVIPVKVDIGEFHCEGRDVFYIDNDMPKIGDKTYSFTGEIGAVASTDTPVVAPVVIPPPVVVVDPIVSALSTAKNIGVSVTNQLETASDIQAYYVDVGIKSVVDFEFSCPTSTRFTNDWTLSIYDESKKLVGTPLVINGSDCGTGLVGDNGTLFFSVPKSSTRSYIVVTSACDAADKATCKVFEKSSYEIKRLIPTPAPSIPKITPPCFKASCDASTEKLEPPVFGK